MNDKDEQRKKDLFAVMLWIGIWLLKLLPVVAIIVFLIWLAGYFSV